jgi:hypothetical protein
MPLRKLIWPLVALLLCSPLYANQDALRNGHPERYVVQKGDTLWDISQRFLTDPWLWPEIWYNNPEIGNPHLIYPGDTISLAFVDGKPRLTIERADRAGPTVKLSPQVREESLERAIPTIPLEAIRPFLTETRVVEPGALEAAPYIVAGSDERVMSSESDRIYVRRLDAQPQQGYSVLRKGDAYVDPDTQQVLGVEARHLGDASTVASGDPATLRVQSYNREILPGDRVLPQQTNEFTGNFFPKAPATQVEGKIIDVVDGVSQIGQFSIVAINRGQAHGLEVGDVLAVFKAGETVRDAFSGKRGDKVTLPDERAGELIVFRTFNNMSFGLVMEASRAMHIMDAVRNP